MPVARFGAACERAEAEGDLATAIAAQRVVAQFVHPRPKPIEFDPEGAVELARALKDAATTETANESFVDLVERMNQQRELEQAAAREALESAKAS